MQRELVVGIVGAVVLMGALVGILYVQSATATKDVLYKVEWTTAGGLLDPVAGRSDTGSPTIQNVTLDLTNLTEVTFTLTWTDDDPSAADAVFLNVTTPTGRQLTQASGTSGTLVVKAMSADLNPVPSPTQIAAADAGAAKTKLAAANTGHGGHGDWTVSVSVTGRTGNTPPGPIPSLPVFPADTGNEWSLKVEYKVYQPALATAT